MAKITPIYQFYTHERGDIVYPYNDEKNMVTSDNQFGGLYGFIGVGVRTGWDVTKMVSDPSYSESLNTTIRNEQIALFDGALNSLDSYLGRRITAMNMQPIISCSAATVGNLSANYDNGLGTLTNNGTQARLSIDGVLLSNGHDVIIKNQSTPQQNGIYTVTNQGSDSQNWVLTRHSSLNLGSEFLAFKAAFYCYWSLSGDTNGKTIWTLDINPSFTLGSTAINFQNAFEQCVRVTPGEGIVGLYKAYTEETVYFRYYSSNVYYVWASSSPCLATEGKALIVSPSDPDYNYDSYHLATYLANVQVNTKTGGLFNVYVDYVEYDDRRNALQNLEGAFEAALRRGFYKHVHLGGTDHPSKINLSTTRTLFARGPIGSTIFLTYDENGSRVSSWVAANYGFPEVRLNNTVLASSAYTLDPSTGRIYLKNSLTVDSVIQIILPLSPQIKLTIKQGSVVTDNLIFLTQTWDSGEYLEPTVYLNDVVVSSDLYTLVPGQGTIAFDPVLTDSTLNLYVILEKVGREITGLLPGTRLKDINGSLFTKNQLDPRRISPMDHVGQVRYLESALLRPAKKLFSAGDHQKFYPEDTTQDLQYNTEILKIATSVNKSGTFYFGTKRGLMQGTALTNVNFDSSWNPDNGEIISVVDDIMRASEVNVSSNRFETIYVLTNQGRVYKSYDKGVTWQKLKMPVIGATSSSVVATAFLASTQIESYEENGLIKYKWYTLLYLGTNVGLFTAVIQENQSDADWAWSDAWSNVTGDKQIYALAEVVTQRVNTVEGSTTYSYDRTIYIGSDKGFSIASDSGAYVSTRLVSTEIPKGFLWIRGTSANDLLWFTDTKVNISHTARRIETRGTNSYTSEWTHPLSDYSTTRFSLANKISCLTITTSNVNLNAAPLIVDGITLSNGNKILVKGQTDQKQNGIYSVTSAGTGSNGIWARSSDTLTTSTWVQITAGTNWIRSVWALFYTEQSDPQNSSINLGVDLINFTEILINPIVLPTSDYPFVDALERVGTNKYVVTSTTNTWLLTDRKIVGQDYAWDYPYVYKGNWSEDQAEIKSVFFNASNSSYLYAATKEGLYYSTNPDSLLTLALGAQLNTTDTTLIVTEPSKLFGYTKIVLTSTTDSVELEIDVNVSTVNGIDIYSIDITSSPTRTSVFSIANTIVEALEDNRKVTSIIWKRLSTKFLAVNPPNIYSESLLAISSDGTALEGLVDSADYSINEAFQLVKFTSAAEIGNSFLYENDFTTFYTDSWDSDAQVFVYVNGVATTKPYTVYPTTGQIIFLANLASTDVVKITIIKLNKYIKNTGVTPHAEQSNSLVRGALLTKLASDLISAAPSNTQIFVSEPNSIPLNTTLLDLVWTAGAVYERTPVKVSVNSKTGIREIFLLSTRPSTSLTLPATNTEVYAVAAGSVPGIEDQITLAQANQYYHFNSVAGANLSQLSLAAMSAKDLSDNLIFPKLFTNFFSEPVPVYAEFAKRGPVNSLFYDFSTTPADIRGSSSSYYVGLVPSEANSASPPRSFYYIYNPSYSGNNLRIGTDKGIWIYTSSTGLWKKETALNNAGKVYFIKPQDGSSSLMAGTDIGLFEQQDDLSWSLNATFPQAIFDHATGAWGTNYTFIAYGKNDGLSFVRQKSDGSFISDHFDAVDEKNVYGLYKNKFYRLVDDGQGGQKQTLVDVLFLCTNNGLYGVCDGARSGDYSSLLSGREMFGANPNLVTINLPDGGTQQVSVKYYKVFNSPKPTKNNQPPVPIIILSSNGVFTVINWRWCDPNDAASGDFVVANHNLQGLSCTCYATASELIGDDKFVYKIFVGTDKGVYRSFDDARTFERCERINGQDLAIHDIKSLGGDCLLVATDQGLWYSNDEGDSWYKTNELPDLGDPCVSFRSSIDSGEYFTNGYLAQTFKPRSSTLNKVSLYLGRDDVDSSDPSLDNVLTVGIYNTVLSGGEYLPNLSSPLVINNLSTNTLIWGPDYRNNSGSATKNLTDNYLNDKKTYEESTNTLTGDPLAYAGITAIYNLTSSKDVDQMTAQVYYTQNPTFIFEYSDNGTDWTLVHEFIAPIHGGAGKWEDVTWKLFDTALDVPTNVTLNGIGTIDGLGSHSYKITAVSYLGETTSTTVTRTGLNSTLDVSNYNIIQWSAVAGAISYNIYGRVGGSEVYLGNSTTTVYLDKGVGPSGGAASPPTINTSANLASHQYWRIALKDSVDADLDTPPTRVARIGDFRVYNNSIQYTLPEKLIASEIEYPGFKSFIINVTGLTTTTTYALVARELDSSENPITGPSPTNIIKWFKSNL